MSKITLEPNSSGAGTFSIVSPDSNTNRTLTLPDEEGTVATIENIPPGYEDQDALDLFNATGSAPVYACRAWVNFDGRAENVRGGGNVSSVTDRADAGMWTVNFTTNMPDNNYSAHVTSHRSGAAVACADGDALSTSSVDVYIGTASNNTNGENQEFSVAVFR